MENLDPLHQQANEFKAAPMTYKGAVQATEDKVMLTSNENETFIIKVFSFKHLISIRFDPFIYSCMAFPVLILNVSG